MKCIVAVATVLLCPAFAFSQNFGIGTSSPSEKLDVNGSIRSSSLTGSNIHLAVDPDGVLTKLCYAYVSGYNQPDGTDVGYIPYRILTFTKQQANTNLRIS